MYPRNRLTLQAIPATFIIALMMVAPAAAKSIPTSTEVASSFEPSLYEKKPAASTWVTANGLHDNTNVLIKAIADAEAHGLSPTKYRLSSLEQELNSFVTNIYFRVFAS